MKQLLLFLLILSINASSQSYAPIRKAERAISKTAYPRAIKKLESALELDPDNEYIHYRLGYSYSMMNKYENAIHHYVEASKLMEDSMKYHFELYHIYSSLGLQTFAKQSFIKYVHLCPSCVKTDLLPGMNSNKLMYKQPIKEPILMGYETDKAEYFPYIMDDKYVQHLNAYLDKSKPSHSKQYKTYLTDYYSEKDFMFYLDKEFRQYNRTDGYLYGPFTLNKLLNRIYITRWNSDRKRLFIYYSYQSNDKYNAWKRYRVIEIEGDNEKSNYIHPMLTKDEKHLIFSSDKPGGLGGYDLWIGDIEEETKLKNIRSLGTYVNTPGDEVFPNTYDEEVLFFASDGHYGFGSLDLYAGIKSKEKYRKTYNLGNRFNSTYDDYALFSSKSKNISFFTSNRYLTYKDSMPFDRIYSQTFDKIKGVVDVVDQNMKAVSDLKVEIISEKINTKTNENGKADVNISPVGYKRVTVSGEKYSMIDTVMSPFESKLSLKIEKRAPKDVVNFSLVSFPFERPAPNAFYILTSTKDNQRYVGTTDAYGMGEVTLYADEIYDLEVPKYSYTKKGIQLGGLKIPAFPVYNDNPVKKEPIKAASTTAVSLVEEPLSENYNIYYASGQWVMTENLNRQIQNTVFILNQNPTYKLELTAHTDCQGDNKFNLDLSKMRLEEAKRIFFSRGVSEKQIIGKYKGETIPANDCRCDEMENYDCASDEMRKNRRTEVKIIK